MQASREWGFVPPDGFLQTGFSPPNFLDARFSVLQREGKPGKVCSLSPVFHMKTPAIKIALITALCAFAVPAARLAAQDITLPAPQKTGGMPLMEALAKRSTARVFDPARELSQQQLSNLLWAAWGVNRPDGRRTAPSASNKQEIDIYVLIKQGAYRYDAQAHKLVGVAAGRDVRESSGTPKQNFVKDSPLTLVFVADFTKLSQAEENEKYKAASINTGFISQNVYLYCASEGLISVVRTTVARARLATELALKDTQKIIAAHNVGHARKQ